MLIPFPLLLLLFIVAGCFHTSREAAMLAPVVAQFTQQPFDQSQQPEYLVFADERTAGLFKGLSRNPHYRILPRGKTFVCPSDVTPCPQPHMLRVGIVQTMGDSAVATIDRTYYEGGMPIQESEQILLIRRNGRWEVARVLGYSRSVLG